MEHLATLIYQTLQNVYGRVFLGYNPSTVLEYPYVTYTLDAEALAPSSEGFYLDMDIFDRNASYAQIFAVEGDFKEQLDNYRFMTDQALFRFRYSGSTNIDTMDNELKRRNVRFYVKIDWRK